MGNVLYFWTISVKISWVFRLSFWGQVSYSAVGFVLNVAFILVLLMGFIFVWVLVFEILFSNSQLLHQSLGLLFFLLDGVLKLHGFVSQLPYLQFYPMLFGLYVPKLLLLCLLNLKLIKELPPAF